MIAFDEVPARPQAHIAGCSHGVARRTYRSGDVNRTSFTQRLELRQSQTLIMTPQLEQAIKMLQLSNLELADFIDGEIQQNPLLERRERRLGENTKDDDVSDGERASPTAVPGLAFDPPLAQPVVPDILMRTQPEGGWVVELNAETLPRVLVNQSYYDLVRQATRSKTEKDYLTERLHAANWLVKLLHQRATTILKVAAEIVRQQDAFFRHGVPSLRPLNLRDIADAIGLHESTVSRATRNKYVGTPRGLYELKYFFTSAIPAEHGGWEGDRHVVTQSRKVAASGSRLCQ
jgi:DNA-directed RNA polymerase specialized sigma54-like protein